MRRAEFNAEITNLLKDFPEDNRVITKFFPYWQKLQSFDLETLQSAIDYLKGAEPDRKYIWNADKFVEACRMYQGDGKILVMVKMVDEKGHEVLGHAEFEFAKQGERDGRWEICYETLPLSMQVIPPPASHETAMKYIEEIRKLLAGAPMMEGLKDEDVIPF